MTRPRAVAERTPTDRTVTVDLEHDSWEDDPRRSPRGRRRGADTPVLDLASWERYLVAFDESGAHLFRLALLLVSDPDEAEDLVRQVFLRAHAPWRDGRIDDFGASLRRGLTKIVVDERPRPADGPVRSGLLGALDRLDPDARVALVLRYYEGLSAAETAAVLDADVATVRRQVTGALEVLRPSLETVR